MLQIQLPGYVFQLHFVEWQVDSLHLVCVDPRPNDVGMTATFFLVKYDGAGLIFQTELLLYLLDSRFKDLNRHTLGRRWAETQGEKRLFGTSPLAHCMDFNEGGR